MNLIIVESPTKARTLSKFLGSDYQIEASFGHIRDLPEHKMGVDVEHDFTPTYVVTEKQDKLLADLQKLSKKAKTIYLATDPDREGEAITWHISELLKIKKINRITFHEITKHAIDEALKNPREIDMDLVDAQQARRVLDRLVGYKLSPLLWRKIRRGLSAGRVQSVAVRLVVEREREIESFKPVEYWDINVKLKNVQSSIINVQFVGEIKTKEEADKIEKDLRNAQYSVFSIEKKDFKRTPPAPFTTSTLQQMASNKMGWSAKKTMQVAQKLYEEGLITYHRTDSTNIATEAAVAAQKYITKTFGSEYALQNPRFYKTKSKVAQEAHEAIRPTEFLIFNFQFSNGEEQKLYDLVWKRFIACQMAETTGVSVRVRVRGGDYDLEARGETINFLGWQKLYDQKDQIVLPELKVGEELKFVDLKSEQKFTQGPTRYNDASLIKALEDLGIGRPSTYAPTLSTIQDRRYVEKEEKRFKPTSLGFVVTDFLITHFANIVDYQFTAHMEDELDDIANGKLKWQPVIAEFYNPFAKKLLDVADNSARVSVAVESTGEKCPVCTEGNVVIRLGKFGKFLACSRYPECKYKASYVQKAGMKCPKCTDGDVILRKTKTGKTFFGCSNYPTCDFASWTKPK